MIVRSMRFASRHGAASASGTTCARPRSRATAASTTALAAASCCVHGNAARYASRGAPASGAIAGAMRPGSASTLASSAASSTLRANVPTVSKLALNGCTPAMGIASSVGLKPTTPQ